MAETEFVLPDVGEGLAEVELVRWLVGVGEHVRENQPIAEVETDKAVVEMPAPATGRITWQGAQPGQRIRVGQAWLRMEVVSPADSSAISREGVSQSVEAPAERQASSSAPVLASPAARRLAQELNVPLESVRGTGPDGRITVEDVQRHAAARGPAAEAGEVERVLLHGIRRRMAEVMAQSARTIPHVSGFHEIDAAALVALRERLRPQAEAAGVRFTYLPLLVRATVRALQEHPFLNASLDEDGQTILIKKVYHIGIAVASPEGLVVPVVHHADRLGLLDLARRIDELLTLARAGRLSPEQVRGGTFTITNVGPAGGWFGTSLIRPPEVAILGVGRIEDRPVVRDGQIVIRPILPVTLTFDHRVLDGEAALAFVRTLRGQLEAPDGLVAGSQPAGA
ncbi:MAG: dihydrolipoamide acetyltransferase family protein [Armatimonadota bacterium]|nr:dihydrolipoamide acetyltransferase family protein [Armatimonadota bacterium]MDR7611744.1 dihydrolipoamide acetyltransferase family protein [Armatimonadota bacterium]